MSDQRQGGIAWTDETWNPVRGCSRISEGCRNCYAERVAVRFSGPGQAYEGLADGGPRHPQTQRVQTGRRGHWTGVVRLVPEHLADPLRWRRPRKVFVNSMSDLFHEALSDKDIGRVFEVMGSAQQHTFQVLTKRAQRMRDFVSRYTSPGGPLPILRNVWLGVSVEDQANADKRVPDLLATPAAVRFVSYEPALGPVDFRGWLLRHGPDYHQGGRGCACPRPDWIIVGGESGAGARAFNVQWARDVVSQCRAAGVAPFVKQLGSRPFADEDTNHGDWLTLDIKHSKGADPAEWPEDLRVQEFPQVLA